MVAEPNFETAYYRLHVEFLTHANRLLQEQCDALRYENDVLRFALDPAGGTDPNLGHTFDGARYHPAGTARQNH